MAALEIHSRSYSRGFRASKQCLVVLGREAPVELRHQKAHRLPQQLRGVVPEHCRRAIVGPDNRATGINRKNRLRRCVQEQAHGGFAIGKRNASVEQCAPNRILLQKDDEHAADRNLCFTERFHAQGVPAAVPVLERAFDSVPAARHFRQQIAPRQFSQIGSGPDEKGALMGGRQVEQRCGRRGESCNAQAGIQGQHGNIDTDQQGAKVVRQCHQPGVAVP